MNETDSFARFGQTDGIRANLKRKSIRGAVFMASGNAADILVRVGSIAVLARLLVPADFGLIAMVAAFTGVLESFRDFGLSAATVQRAEITHRQVTNLFWINVLVGGVLALTLSGASPLIASFYQDERLIGISIALSLVFVWNGLAVQHEALLIRQLRQGELSLIRLLASALSVAIAIVLALAGWGYWALVLREIMRVAFITFGVWLRCLWLPGLPRRNVETMSLVRFGGELSVTSLLSGLIANVDKLLIGRFFGASAVGMYRQAFQLVLAPIEQINGPIVGVAQPALSALQRDPDRYRKFYEKIVFVVSTVTAPLGLFVAVCAEEITLLMLGRTWIDAVVFVRIFGVAAAIRPAIATTAIVLVTCGYSTRYLALAILHSVVLIVLLLLGLNWGATGIAVAFVGTTCILAYPKLYYSFQKTPATIRGFFSAAQAPIIAASVMTVSLVSLDQLSVVTGVIESLLLSAFVGAIAYFSAMWLQPRGRAELRALRTDIRSALDNRRGAVAAELS